MVWKHLFSNFFQILRCLFHAFILFQQIPVQDSWRFGAMFWLNQKISRKNHQPPRLNRIFKDLASLVIDQATDNGMGLNRESLDVEKSPRSFLFSENKKQRDVSRAYLKKISSHEVTAFLMNQDKCPGLLWLFFQVYIEDYIRVKHNPLATCPQVMIQSWFRLVWKLLEVRVYIHFILYIQPEIIRFHFFSFSPCLQFFGVVQPLDFGTKKKNGSFFLQNPSVRSVESSGNGLGSDRFQHREDLSVSWDTGDGNLGWWSLSSTWLKHVDALWYI